MTGHRRRVALARDAEPVFRRHDAVHAGRDPLHGDEVVVAGDDAVAAELPVCALSTLAARALHFSPDDVIASTTVQFRIGFLPTGKHGLRTANALTEHRMAVGSRSPSFRSAAFPLSLSRHSTREAFVLTHRPFEMTTE